MSDDAAAASTAPAPASIQAAVRRSPRNASQTARAAACSSGESSWLVTAERAIAYATMITPPAAAAPTPSSMTVLRRSGETTSAPATNPSDRRISRIAMIRTRSATFASVGAEAADVLADHLDALGGLKVLRERRPHLL